MPLTGNQRPRNGSRSGSNGGGLQLLSPTMQHSIQNTPCVLSSSHPTEFFGWSTTPPAGYSTPDFELSIDDDKENNDNIEKNGDDSSIDDFDFDGFTLASVRGRGKQYEQVEPGAPLRQSSHQVRTNSFVRAQQFGVTDEYCAFYYNEDKLASSKPPNPLSCSTSSAQTTRITDDFDMLERSRRLRKQSMSQEQNRFACSSIANRTGRGTLVTSSTAAAAGWPMAKKKEQTAMVMNGWLQKRKGLVLKRWKPYYCLFKSDDSLCIYTSEDTVNGKLEQRYQILRVVLTDKNDSFHIIGVDAEGAPRREEFRAGVSTEWTRWFQVLHSFFDSTSLEQAFLRKPELTSAPAISDKYSERSARNSNNEVIPAGEAKHLNLNNRYTNFGTSGMPGMQNYQPYDERRSYLGPRKMSSSMLRGSFDGMGDDQTSTASSFSASSVLGQAKEATAASATRLGNQKAADCPMIERDSQIRVPLLEVRGSESMTAKS